MNCILSSRRTISSMTNATSGTERPLSPLRGFRVEGRVPSGLRHWLSYFAAPPLLAIAACALMFGRAAASDQPAVALKILPPEPVLTGPHASQQLVVEEMRGGQFAGDVTASAKFTSSHPQISQVNATGVVTPVGDGTATIRAEVGGRVV